MKFSLTQTAPADIEADAVVVGLYEDESPSGAAAAVDAATGGALTRLIEAGEVKREKLAIASILAPAGVKATQVVIVGLGRREGVNRQIAFEATAAAAKTLASKQRKTLAYYLAGGWASDLLESAVAGSIVGCQGQDLYRKERKLTPPEEILFASDENGALESGRALGEGVNLARRLVNEPASEIYPESFAQAATEMANNVGLSIDVWDQAKLEAEKCGSLLGVARGSIRPPRLVIMRHAGGSEGAPTLALVGKGVTFDSGGYSLKLGENMLDMKCDMAGAAAVVGAMQTIARLKLPVNVIGLAGLVENLVSGDAYKLGDVLTARSGKTIEVLNTDAEGRLVLADVLDVARSEGASKIIDLATLTGACVVALGNDIAGLMTNDQSWCDAVKSASETAGEETWQLPMHEFFDEQIKSKVADIKNIGDGRWGGAITAAKLLEEFVGDTPWVHIDIAGPAFLSKPKSWIDAGGSGCLVRTLVEVARNWQ